MWHDRPGFTAQCLHVHVYLQLKVQKKNQDDRNNDIDVPETYSFVSYLRQVLSAVL